MSHKLVSGWRWSLRVLSSRRAGPAGVLLVYAIGLSLHTILRGHADDLGLASTSGAPLEQFIFHGMPSLWLQRWTPDATAFNFLAAALHFSFFFLPLILVLFVSARLGVRTALQLVLLQLALFFSADVFYALCPTRPPWMDLDIVRVIQSVYGHQMSIDDNTTASIPSLHIATPMLLTLWFARQQDGTLRKLSPFLGLWTLGIAGALVYSGEHYVVGVMAGAAWAAGVYVAYCMATVLRSKPAVRRDTKPRALAPGHLPQSIGRSLQTED